MIFVGVDPDLHHSALAAVDETGQKVWALLITEVDSKFKEQTAAVELARKLAGQISCLKNMPSDVTAFAVEAQEISYTAKSGKNPRSILHLAPATGMWLLAGHQAWPGAAVFNPLPQAWKGSVPKQIHQARILTAIGWQYERVGKDHSTGYCRPTPGGRGDEQMIEDVTARHGKAVWKHLVDAIGLALWARDEWTIKSRQTQILGRPVGSKAGS